MSQARRVPDQTALRRPIDWAARGASAPDVAQVLHATTLATNLVIEQRGTTTALVVTRGYGEILEIGRQKRWDTYDLRVDRRPPIVARRYVYEVSEQLAHDSSVITPLDEAEVRALARTLVAAGIAALGICLIPRLSQCRARAGGGAHPRGGSTVAAHLPLERRLASC